MTDRLLVDTRGASELLSLSARTVERLSSSGELPSFRVGGLRRFRVADLEAFVASLASPVTLGVRSRAS